MHLHAVIAVGLGLQDCQCSGLRLFRDGLEVRRPPKADAGILLLQHLQHTILIAGNVVVSTIVMNLIPISITHILTPILTIQTTTLIVEETRRSSLLVPGFSTSWTTLPQCRRLDSQGPWGVAMQGEFCGKV